MAGVVSHKRKHSKSSEKERRLVWCRDKKKTSVVGTANDRGNGRREDGEVRGSRIMWAITGILNLSKNKLLSSCLILSKERV